MQTGSQQVLQHAEGQRLAGARRRRLADHCSVEQAAGAGQSDLTWARGFRASPCVVERLSSAGAV